MGRQLPLSVSLPLGKRENIYVIVRENDVTLHMAAAVCLALVGSFTKKE